MSTLIDRSHAVLGHDFLIVVWETLRIDDEATHPIDEQHTTQLDHSIKESIRIPVRHAQQFMPKLIIIETERHPDLRRNDGGAVRDMNHKRNGFRFFASDDFEIHREPLQPL